MTSNSLPPPVQAVMQDYIGQVDGALPGLLAGVYLHGSVALGAYQHGLSDIDFITVASRTCEAHELAVLQAIHQALEMEQDASRCAHMLVRLALQGGAPDNVTVIIADVVDEP